MPDEQPSAILGRLIRAARRVWDACRFWEGRAHFEPASIGSPPADTVWLIRAASGPDAATLVMSESCEPPEGHRLSEGSGVVVQVRHGVQGGPGGLGEDGVARRWLLTAAHVVIDYTAEPPRLHDEVYGWSPGRGYNRPFAVRLQIARHPFAIAGNGTAEAPFVDSLGSDWVLLQPADEEQTRLAPAATPTRLVEDGDAGLRILGYPAGLRSVLDDGAGGRVEPTPASGFSVQNLNSIQLTLVDGSDTTAGMSGGGVFDAHDRLVGLHSHSADSILARGTLRITSIDTQLRELSGGADRIDVWNDDPIEEPDWRWAAAAVVAVIIVLAVVFWPPPPPITTSLQVVLTPELADEDRPKQRKCEIIPALLDFETVPYRSAVVAAGEMGEVTIEHPAGQADRQNMVFRIEPHPRESRDEMRRLVPQKHASLKLGQRIEKLAKFNADLWDGAGPLSVRPGESGGPINLAVVTYGRYLSDVNDARRWTEPSAVVLDEADVSVAAPSDDPAVALLDRIGSGPSNVRSWAEPAEPRDPAVDGAESPPVFTRLRTQSYSLVVPTDDAEEGSEGDEGSGGDGPEEASAPEEANDGGFGSSAPSDDGAFFPTKPILAQRQAEVRRLALDRGLPDWFADDLAKAYRPPERARFAADVVADAAKLPAGLDAARFDATRRHAAAALLKVFTIAADADGTADADAGGRTGMAGRRPIISVDTGFLVGPRLALVSVPAAAFDRIGQDGVASLRLRIEPALATSRVGANDATEALESVDETNTQDRPVLVTLRGRSDAAAAIQTRSHEVLLLELPSDETRPDETRPDGASPDGAALERAGWPSRRRPLRLVASAAVSRRDWVAAGFTHYGNDRLLGRVEINPGQIVRLPQADSDDWSEALLGHDALTGPGGTGGPLIDLATGDVVGVHFARVRAPVDDYGLAIPTATLLRDAAFAARLAEQGRDPGP